MPQCELLHTCVFLRRQTRHVPRSAERYRHTFCLADCWTCARYQVAQKLGHEAVPGFLLPDDYERAQKMISKRGR